MTTTNESKRDKLILLAILLLSSLFVLGCSIKGEEPVVEPIKYEFSVGRYSYNSTNSYQMFYAAVNREFGTGNIKDVLKDGKHESISSFYYAYNPYIENNNKYWVSDGYYEVKNTTYGPGTYAISLNCWEGDIEKYLTWEGIPDWESSPSIEFNKDVISVSVIPRLTETEQSKELKLRYRIKVYPWGLTSTRLFTQSEPVYYNGKRNSISCTLPRKLGGNNNNEYVCFLVAELYNSSGIQMILYYEGPKIKY